MSKQKMNKPDRWERMVEKFCHCEDGTKLVVIHLDEAAYLLRREHKAIVRDMKQLTRYGENTDYRENQKYLGVFEDGAYVRLDDVLDALAKRAR